MFVPINREYMSSLKGGIFTTTESSVSDSMHAKVAIKNTQAPSSEACPAPRTALGAGCPDISCVYTLSRAWLDAGPSRKYDEARR
jgi:hypothetical protein